MKQIAREELLAIIYARKQVGTSKIIENLDAVNAKRLILSLSK